MRETGLEPASTYVHMNLNHARLPIPPFPQNVDGGGFEPPKLSRQIYSLLPLATREPVHMQLVSPAGEKDELAMGLEPATC